MASIRGAQPEGWGKAAVSQTTTSTTGCTTDIRQPLVCFPIGVLCQGDSRTTSSMPRLCMLRTGPGARRQLATCSNRSRLQKCEQVSGTVVHHSKYTSKASSKQLRGSKQVQQHNRIGVVQASDQGCESGRKQGFGSSCRQGVGWHGG